MEQLRKIGLACWDAKEKFVLVLMVMLLGFRVYLLLKNQPEVEGAATGIDFPAKEFKDVVATPPPIPPGVSPPPITPLIRNSLFDYVRPSSRASTRNSNIDSKDAKVRVLVIVPDGSGGYKARITTGGAKRLISEGESFESYTLMKIDNDTQCCEIYSENTSSTIERCVE